MTPNLTNRKKIRRQVDWGRSESLKREENGREKTLGHAPPSFSIFIPRSGVELCSCEGLDEREGRVYGTGETSI